MPVASISLTNRGSGQNVQSVYRTFYICFLPKYSSHGPGVAEEIIKWEKLTDDRRQVMAKAHFTFGKMSTPIKKSNFELISPTRDIFLLITVIGRAWVWWYRNTIFHRWNVMDTTEFSDGDVTLWVAFLLIVSSTCMSYKITSMSLHTATACLPHSWYSILIIIHWHISVPCHVPWYEPNRARIGRYWP